MPVGVAVVLASSNARAGTPSAKMRFPVADEVVLLVDPVLLALATCLISFGSHHQIALWWRCCFQLSHQR